MRKNQSIIFKIAIVSIVSTSAWNIVTSRVTVKSRVTHWYTREFEKAESPKRRNTVFLVFLKIHAPASNTNNFQDTKYILMKLYHVFENTVV